MQPAAIVFKANGWIVRITDTEAARLADTLDALAAEGLRGAASARSRIDHALEGGHDGLDWYPDEKDALMTAIYRWIETDEYANVPEHVRSDLRYALFGDWQDEVRGTYLFELERDGAIAEVPVPRDRAPVRGQQVRLIGETWIIRSIAPLAAGTEYVATVRALWHPG
jgi:hypothetical protein